jgi:hypothetical protein
VRTEESPNSAGADQPNADLESVPLSKIERSAAISLGVLATTAGSWAVFATENQAGSAALILIGAAFCLMGLQGTPLIRFGSGNNSLELERRRKRRQVEIAVRTAESAQALEAIVEGASILDPGIVDTLAWQSSIYQTRVMLAVKSMGAFVGIEDADISGADLVLRWNPDGSKSAPATWRGSSRKMVEISLKYLSEGQKLRSLQIPREDGRPNEYAVPMIVVTNAPISAVLEEKIAEGQCGITDAVTWNSESDNPKLASAIRRAGGLRETGTRD